VVVGAAAANGIVGVRRIANISGLSRGGRLLMATLDQILKPSLGFSISEEFYHCVAIGWT